MKKIGFIGTGVMGKGMIRNLMKNGFELYVYNRTKEKALPLLEEGAFWCDTPALCAAGRDAVITMVGFPKDVEEVYFGENGVFAGADPGTYLVDMTTTEPQLSVKIYQEGKARGFHVVDAPVSGGEGGAVNATLSIMAGGDPEDFEACRPLWEAMGSSAVYEGKAGSGQHVKMANQIAIAGTVTGWPMPCGRESPRKNCSRPFPGEQPAAGSCPIWGRKWPPGITRRVSISNILSRI